MIPLLLSLLYGITASFVYIYYFFIFSIIRLIYLYIYIYIYNYVYIIFTLFYDILILGTNINLRTSIQQKTPLMIALEHNQLDTVLMLLRCGAMMSLELVDVNGWTPLHYAACYGRIELAMVRVVGVVAVVVVNSSVLLQYIVVVVLVLIVVVVVL